MELRLEADDLQTLRALAALPQGHALIGLLQRELQASDVTCRTLEGAALHRAQGHSQCLAGLIEWIRTASSTLKSSSPISRVARHAIWAEPGA